LNPVENVWPHLRANWLAISVFDDYPAIVDACCLAWNRFADDPKTVTSIRCRDRDDGQQGRARQRCCLCLQNRVFRPGADRASCVGLFQLQGKPEWIDLL